MMACLFVCAAAYGQLSCAESDVAPLTASEVLASSHRHFPEILQRLAAQRAAQGKVMQADGAFDLVFSAEGFSRVSGFYDGTALQGEARQRIRPLGAELYTGYKLSDGTFPIYEDIAYTNSGGALKVGALFSLLRDRSIDQQRFAEKDARLSVTEADLDLLLTKIGVQQRAIIAYWKWVTIGRQLRIYENLVGIAIERQDSLEKQVRSGARAQIFLTENLQNITRRQSLVTSAQRDLAVAANSLSFFYRDELGRSNIPDSRRLPPGVPMSQVDDLTTSAAAATSDAVLRRPEIALVRTAIQREQQRIALSENNLKPRVDLDIGVQTGLGSIAEGGPSRDSTDTVIGIQFSVPLQRSKAKGKLMQSRAELEAKRQEQRLMVEQIQIEVRNILRELYASRELLTLAAQEVALSEILRASELRRFQSGASDFFLVNLREETAANARIKVLQAELDTRIARAEFDAATVNLDRLEIRDSTP